MEANDWIGFEMVGFFDGKNYWQFDSVGKFLDHVLSKRYRGFHIFGHYAGKYDDLFLLDDLHKRRKKIGFDIIAAGSKIIALKFSRHKHRWIFADSSALFPAASLEKLTTSFDVEHKKLVGSIDFKGGERVDKNNPVHRRYLENDVRGLYEVLSAYLSDPKIAEDGFQLTVASQAMSLWRRTIQAPIRVTPKPVQEFCREAYFGGRVEIFKMRGSELNLYDVNSMFPFCMRTLPIPLEYKKHVKGIPEFGFCRALVKYPETYIPLLPYKMDDKLIFPCGVFEGVFFSEELKLAMENGAKVIQVKEAVEFHAATDLFTEYIDYFHKMKNQAVKGSGQELIAKYLLNSLYGKWGQREEKTLIKTRENEKVYQPFHSVATFEKFGLINVTKYHRAPYMMVNVAAAITSYARMHMARLAYIPHAENCFYTDTDSIFTDLKMPTGDKLGELKLEKSGFDGVFKQPKAYLLSDKGVILASKIKGFSTDFVKTLSIQEFEKGEFQEKKEIPASLKLSLIRNKSYLSKIGVTKQMRTQYSKRRILKSGDTSPWVIRDSKTVN